MGDIRNARCLFLQVSWNQYGDQRVDPIRRSLTGSITPIMTWILYADHQVDPLCRSLTGVKTYEGAQKGRCRFARPDPISPVALRGANRRCAALSRSVQRLKKTRLSAKLGF
jgi:hypothetical protein